MKKILVIISVLFLLTGCNKEEKTLNFSEIKNNLNNLAFEDKTMFENNQMMDSETLKNKYNVDTTNMEEYLISMPTLVESSNMYIVVKAKEGMENDVKTQLENLMTRYENQWSMGYAPKEEDKVRNRLEEIDGNYFIYIISDDNDLVLETIKK